MEVQLMFLFNCFMLERPKITFSNKNTPLSHKLSDARYTDSWWKSDKYEETA
jgi:hypothetical protein